MFGYLDNKCTSFYSCQPLKFLFLLGHKMCMRSLQILFWTIGRPWRQKGCDPPFRRASWVKFSKTLFICVSSNVTAEIEDLFPVALVWIFPLLCVTDSRQHRGICISIWKEPWEGLNKSTTPVSNSCINSGHYAATFH